VRLELGSPLQGVVLVVFACVSAGGCHPRLLPPNYLRLVTAEQAGSHPELLNFTRGVALESPDGETALALMAGARAVLLFDYGGTRNRVELLFVRDGHQALYERIGQRVDRPAAGRDLGQVGVRCIKDGQQLRGSIDVFLAVTERDDLQIPAPFENYPRAMRLVGYFAVPLPLATDNPPLAGDPIPDADGRRLTAWLADLNTPQNDLLHRLPLVDVRYLVPTTLVDRLVAPP
jgi:hypothetical protein